jgi:hypothetical protein
MRPLIRLLLWILIAALPLQASAVAFMSCGAATAQATTHHHAAMAATAHKAHCEQTNAGHLDATHGKCSHCASCCIGASAPPAVLAMVAPATFSTYAIAGVEPALAGHIPATLERPPRLS